MGFVSSIGSFLGHSSGPPIQETVGTITDSMVDPQGDGKSAAFRLDSMPTMEFRQRPNVLTSVHKRGDRVKVVYSISSPNVATVDYVQMM
jgi:hypothetical protein